MMAEIVVKIGRKAEEKPINVGQSEKAGPLTEDHQGRTWLLIACPWCGGVNRCLDAQGLDVWTCGWCGQLFY